MTAAGRRGSAGPMFFVADLDDPALSPEDRHHAERVLRLRRGEPVVVGDGAGRWRPARWASRLEPAGDVVEERKPVAALTVAFALVKGSKPELVVQKLTEVGIDRIVPFVADRSVVRWDEARSTRAVQRWRAVARAAAMQSKRVWLPEVDDVVDFATAAAAPATVRSDMGGRAPSRWDRRVLVGPEGGWSDTERGHPLEAVSFGPNVLRAETAAIAVGAILVALREGTVAPAPAPGGSDDPPGG